MRHRLGLSVVVALALGACDGQQMMVDTSYGSFSCDFKTGTGDPVCRETSWSGGTYSTMQWSMECDAHTGKGGMMCSRDKVIGGCQTTATAGMISITDTYWFYTGRAADLMASCSGSWVTP